MGDNSELITCGSDRRVRRWKYSDGSSLSPNLHYSQVPYTCKFGSGQDYAIGGYTFI